MLTVLNRMFLHTLVALSGLFWLFNAHAIESSTDVDSNLSLGSQGEVVVSMTNRSAEAVSFLEWETAFESEITNDLFVITPTGRGIKIFESLEFNGRVFRRSAPTEKDFIVLQPGETRTATVQLSDYYDIPGNGLYRVQYSSTALMRLLTSASSTADRASSLTGYSPVPLHSNSVTMDLRTSLGTVRARPPAYNQCSASEQSSLITANDAAEAMAIESLTSLQGLSEADRQSSPRYDEWFGAYTTGRFERVVDTFSAISGALTNEVMTYDCTCDIEDVYAYVYKDAPYEIYICPVFWQTSLVGVDSQAGTIIHEVSHFTVVADTDDVVYGQALAAHLADTDPDLAIGNADNVTYFAENDPVLPLTGELSQSLDDYSTLELDTTVSGSVAMDESVYYTVTGADQFTLESISGDADLEVYIDIGRNILVCASRETSSTDVCQSNVYSTVYIAVLGHTDATFELTARTSQNATNNSEILELPIDEPLTGNIGLHEYRVYRAEEPTRLLLTTESGDADLYVFNSTEFTLDNVVCVSAADVADQVVENCLIPSAYVGEDMYAVVYGYLESGYTIEAVSYANSGLATVTPLIAGESIEGSVAENEFLLFEVTGARRIVLESTSGDADLYVYSNPQFSDLSCFSENAPDEFNIDSCDVEADTVWAAVLGYTASTFTLTADDDAAVDPEATDAGTTTGGTSTGGTSTGSETSTGGTSTDGTSTGSGETSSGDQLPADDDTGGGGGGSASVFMLLLSALTVLRRRKSDAESIITLN